MIDREIKRCLGQMAKGVQVVGATHDGITRAYCSHWVSQVAFEEPIMMCSASPKHDTFPLMEASGQFSVSVLAGDQVAQGQYFSYPGRKFNYIAPEYIEMVDDLPMVVGCISWLKCEIFDRIEHDRIEGLDHVLFFARVTAVQEGRLGEPPLVYSSRHGWRIAETKAREAGVSVRDELLARLAESDASTTN